jgi:hypothetical protein
MSGAYRDNQDIAINEACIIVATEGYENRSIY